MSVFKSSLYCFVRKYVENLKTEKQQDNDDINRTYSNASNDISNEGLVKKKEKIFK